jgi:hypothetical protein
LSISFFPGCRKIFQKYDNGKTSSQCVVDKDFNQLVNFLSENLPRSEIILMAIILTQKNGGVGRLIVKVLW